LPEERHRKRQELINTKINRKRNNCKNFYQGGKKTDLFTSFNLRVLEKKNRGVVAGYM